MGISPQSNQIQFFMCSNDGGEILMKQAVNKCRKINYWNLCVSQDVLFNYLVHGPY